MEVAERILKVAAVVVDRSEEAAQMHLEEGEVLLIPAEEVEVMRSVHSCLLGAEVWRRHVYGHL